MKSLPPSVVEVHEALPSYLKPAFIPYHGVALRPAKEGYSKRPDAAERMAFGFDPITRTRAAYYVHLTLRGKPRHVGTRPTAEAAAHLYDSALYHLFGWMKQPRGFNYYKPGDPVPEKTTEIHRLQIMLCMESRRSGLDPVAWNYDYSQSEDFS